MGHSVLGERSVRLVYSCERHVRARHRTAVGDWRRDGWPALVVTRINENAMALAPRTAGD